MMIYGFRDFVELKYIGMRDSFIQFSVNTMEEILEASYVYPNGKGDDLTEYCTTMNDLY